MNIEQIIKEKKCTIVDVRTPQEFWSGNVEGSVNIPLQEITSRIDEIRSMKMPLVLCCASGARSDMATRFLAGNGIECFNAGSWLDVNYVLSEVA